MEPLPYELPIPVHYTNPVAADDRTGPWPDVATACAKVDRRVRLSGLVVDIGPAGGPVVKYWWPGPGLENADLVEYQTAESWQPFTPAELPGEHAAAAGLSQRDTIAYLFQHLSDAGGNDYGYAWLTEDEQLIVTEDAE